MSGLVLNVFDASADGEGESLRFYIEGCEVDVQDPSLFMDKEEYIEIKQTLDEMLETYADIPLAQ